MLFRSLTAPNGPSQVKLIREATRGVGSNRVQSLEAHGTGTSLGDPIEVQAVAESLGKHRGLPLMMGSAKTNFGHTETAAGVLGVIKSLSQIQRGCVAKHLHLRTLNDYIGTRVMEGMSCVVPLEEISGWGSVSNERMVGSVSSFGFSGTNAHVVLEGRRVQQSVVVHDGSITLAARSGDELTRLAKELAWSLPFGSLQAASKDIPWNFSIRFALKSNKERLLLLQNEVHLLQSKDWIRSSDTDYLQGADVVRSRLGFAVTYPFKRKRFWIADKTRWGKSSSGSSPLGTEVRMDDGSTVYQLNGDEFGMLYTLEDHVVYGAVVVPGAAHLAIAAEQQRRAINGQDTDCVALRSVEIRHG